MQLVEYYRALERYVLAAMKLGSRRGIFCCRAKMHATLFVLSQEFKLPYRSIGMHVFDLDATVETLVERGLLEERLEFPGAVDGVWFPGYAVYTYRLTKDGRLFAKDAVEKMDPRIRRRMKELLEMDLWSLIGYAYVRYPEDSIHKTLVVY
jgi:hypothetical protein